MDRYDPNQWTKTFVSDNQAFCIEQLRSTNAKVIALIKQGEYAPAIAGLDRILNGLITMKNAGGDFSSELCFFSWVEANIMLFGIDAPENKKRETALLVLQDARDFAKSDASKDRLNQMIADLSSGKSLEAMKDIHNSNFPLTDIEMLSSLDSKLSATENPSKQVTAPKANVHESASEKTFCRKCGSQIDKGVKFCPKCGAGTASVKEQAPIADIPQAIELLKNGDERGFSYIYSRTYKYVYARAKCMFSNEQLIKELMQRVYLFAHQNIVSLNSKDNVFDWLRAIVFFQGTAIIKRQRKELLFSEEQGAVFSSLIGKDEIAEQKELDKEDIDIICGCLERVTDDQKVALVAYYHDHLPVKAMKELLSVNEGTINGRLYLGVKKLEEEVKEQEKRLGREIPTIDKVVLEQAIGALLQKYMDISEAEGKVIFAEICRGLDKGGFQALNQGVPKASAPQKKTQNNSNAVLWIVVVVLACIIAYFLLSPKSELDNETDGPTGPAGNQAVQKEDIEDILEEIEEEVEEEEDEQDETSRVDEDEEEEPEQQAPQSEYILPDSNSRYLTDGEVAILTKEELGFARNEIIARHGRIFTNEKYRQYFESKSWYRGVVEPEVFDSNYYEFLNDYEKQNIELIRKYEAMMP